MDMSKAAMAPIQPPISASDRAHPLFSAYSLHRAACNRLMVQADSFTGWLWQYERDISNAAAELNPEYPDFKKWMIDNQGGARPCPAGSFPHNFYFWLEGGRW